MNTDLHRFDLDQEIAFSYAKDKLMYGNTLGIGLLKHIEVEEGTFFTLFPVNISYERLSKLSEGAILPQNEVIEKKNAFGEISYYSKTPNIKKEIGEYLLEMIKNHPGYACVFEDVQTETTDPHLEFFNEYGLLYLNEIYYLLDASNASLKTIVSAIGESDALWYQVFIFTKASKKNEKQLSLEELSNFCQNLQIIIIRAYDGEGYVFWEPKASTIKEISRAYKAS